MRILFFDTETSGLDPQWNVILQLSYQIVESDTWSVQKTVDHFFPWPENKSKVSLVAIETNGLTEDYLRSKHLSERKAALEEFISDRDSCDLLVAHNLEFDKKFIVSSCLKEGVKYANSGWMQSYDTMKQTTKLCKITKEWGRGYKWPKLTELAECLGINFSNITLHDSSGDVELTKICFKKLVDIDFYRLPQGQDFSMSLHVESPYELQFIIKNQKGEPLSQYEIEHNFTKKTLNAARQELIKQWSEQNEEERETLIRVYRSSPKIKTDNDFQSELETLKPKQYVRKVFEELAPTIEKTREMLEKEAKDNVSTWKFWLLKRMRNEYVESRLEPFFQQQSDEYKKRLEQHETAENKAENEFNVLSQKQYEEQKQYLTDLIQGNSLTIEQEFLKVPEDMNLSFPLYSKAKIEGTTVKIELSLPQPKELPQMEGVRLASGNFKIKESTEKKKRSDYSEWIWGLAFYVASYYFNVSPKINTANILGRLIGDNEDSDGLILYNITFDRESFSLIDFSKIELEEALNQLSVSDNNTRKALAQLFEK
jgi:DNA polymerase III epsilon subunit-like protein